MMSNKVRSGIIVVMVLLITTVIVKTSYSIMSELGFNTDNEISFNSTLKVTYQNSNELEVGKKDKQIAFSVVNYGTIDMEYEILIETEDLNSDELNNLTLKFDEKEYNLNDLEMIDNYYLLYTGAINRENTSKDAISHRISLNSSDATGKLKIHVQSKAINDLASDVITSLNYTNNKFGLALDYNDDVRYVGENSYNYVSYNNELWRIIGVFKVKDTMRDVDSLRVKIIKDIPLGMREFDGETTIFDNSEIYNFLNGQYYETLKNIKVIDYANFKVGNYYSNYDKDDALKSERNGKEIATIVSMPTVADYLYASSWMQKDIWLLSSGEQSKLYFVNDEGIIGEKKYNERALVSPVVYLNSNVRIIDGDGSRTKPFVIK